MQQIFTSVAVIVLDYPKLLEAWKHVALQGGRDPQPNERWRSSATT